MSDNANLIRQYDSLEDPESKSEFLDSIGMTGAQLKAARRLLSSAESTTEADGSTNRRTSRRSGPLRRERRAPRRPRVATTRPRNRSVPRPRRKTYRAAGRVVVIIIYRNS